MNTNISEWLERKTGDTKRQMALKLGQQPSTFNRNIESAEVIVAVCRAYGINPVEGLIAAEVVHDFEVRAASSDAGLREVSEISLLEEVLRRAANRSDISSLPPLRLVDEDPDYSNMSEQDAKDYGLAAKKADPNIGPDDIPHQP